MRKKCLFVIAIDEQDALESAKIVNRFEADEFALAEAYVLQEQATWRAENKKLMVTEGEYLIKTT